MRKLTVAQQRKIVDGIKNVNVAWDEDGKTRTGKIIELDFAKERYAVLTDKGRVKMFPAKDMLL